MVMNLYKRVGITQRVHVANVCFLLYQRSNEIRRVLKRRLDLCLV